MHKKESAFRKHRPDLLLSNFVTIGFLSLGTIPAVQADDSLNVELVGYHPLQGRQALQITTKSDSANGNWAYIGHVPNSRTGEATLNPITGRQEWNGTSIVDISNPSDPRLVWHIPNQENANSRSVSVVYDYGFNSQPAERDYLIRNMEAGDDLKFQIFDITDRATNPASIELVSEITATPENSCGPGCGGKLINRAHKGYWSQDTGLFYSAAGEPGFRTTVLLIWDLKDPRNPKFVGRAWLPGQKDGEDGFEDQYAHHPIVDEENNRMYAGFRIGSGHIAAWDISDPSVPELIWSYDTSPPGRGPHTVSPIVYEEVPNVTAAEGALPRTYALVSDEYDGLECNHGMKSRVYMFDITHDSHPMPVSTWQVPIGDFCTTGGNFGPHQHAETVNGYLNRFEDRLAWIAYMNAGVRVLDISDPQNLREVGYYIPQTNATPHPGQARPGVIQLTDVDIDHRGLVYATDRSGESCLGQGDSCVGTGLFVLEYSGDRNPGNP
ncbi:MAG: hypothetical protein KJN90_05810 [Gammaproteobacteria bacterium]|nr:hypothetical protein [Gammaproteobacteria bacterium]